MKLDDLHDDETRTTDGSTGGQKGKKLTQLGALDPIALIYLARVAGMGANKYAPHNYLKGYNWSLTHDAGQRHALLFWAGEDIDPESGLPHPAHEAWHALAKLSFYLRGIGTDDRPPKPADEEETAEPWPVFNLVPPPVPEGQPTYMDTMYDRMVRRYAEPAFRSVGVYTADEKARAEAKYGCREAGNCFDHGWHDDVRDFRLKVTVSTPCTCLLCLRRGYS